jgi:putative ABC transport system permease protein
MARDLLWAVRRLFKNPWFTAAVTCILALGIGANTAIFSIVDAVLLRPLPVESSVRLLRVEEAGTQRPIAFNPAQDYFQWRDRRDLFDKTVPYLKDFVTLTSDGSEPDQVVAVRTSAGLFSLLPIHPELGRPLVDSDDDFSSPNTVVLSDRLWRRRFHADPHAIGRAMTISNEVFTIVGVMPPEFDFPYSNIELWTPFRLSPADTIWLNVMARMKPGISIAQVQNAMTVVAHRLEQQDPELNAGLRIVVSAWRESTERQYELTLVFVMIAVGLVLLIACADVSSLLLSRAVQRQREIAIRASLGAGFWRVVRQLLAESLVLAGLGSAAGIAVAHYLLQFLSKQLVALPIVLPHLQRVALDGRVLLFNASLCLLLACICGLAPVLLASKTDVQGVLRSGAAAGGSKRSSRLFSILIACEAAFAFLLLAGSGLMIQSLIRLQRADHGFHPDHVLTMRVPVGTITQPRPEGQYDTRAHQMEYYRQLVERLQEIPGVSELAVVNNLPLSSVNTSTWLRQSDGATFPVSTRTISPKYFAAMGIPLLKGRIFTEADRASAPEVAIINEFLAHQLFTDIDPVGQTLHSANPDPVTVVGVVKDSSQMSYDQPVKGEVYLPYQQVIFGTFMSTIVARTSGDPLSLANTLRREIRAVDPNQPVMKVETMDGVIADSIWRPRFSAWIFSALGGLALLLTSAGIYGVVAYTTTLKAKEVGIRVALGASPLRVVAVILRDVMLPLCVGLIVSLAAGLLLSRLLASLLYEISTTDPLTYLAALALVLAIGTAASARPAWKAAVSDPLTSLRAE